MKAINPRSEIKNPRFKEMWGIRIAAYCLMPNHYHLLVQTPHANLSRSMRHLNGIYTQRYNRRHGCDGQLFRGRYKAIVVEEDNYLLQLMRYIHKNPVKAKDLVPDTVRIVNAVSAFYWFSEADLYFSRRGYFNEPRNVAVYLARKLRRDTLTQLCKDFSINKYSSVSSIMGRMEKRMSEHETLRKNISQIKDIIQKSQGQT